ncbi:BAHD acyltransferase At5g47980-like [Impatiens glandulifera]|uniref:BAHD acyltransferase At5g47980-like n=1 Tax=Impatiens glandulifera TaxID=253017 RepID=UPI001FB06269|nr:BAHD acyltransferase At5g47980-like [Impatiens glandulifera]
MDGINVNIVSRNIIKPNSPTPTSQKTFKLSLIDQLTPEFYGATIFFYTSNVKSIETTSDMSKSLQDSLSRILPKFYPLAGQFKDSSTIDCNDEGAYFFDAHVNCNIRQVLDKPDSNFLKKLLPTDPKTVESCSRAVAIFQFTQFECGGVALSACICHKMGDISTLSTFLRSWTAAATNDPGKDEVPDFIGGSLLTHRNLPMMSNVGLARGKCRTQRIVFDGSKIASLRAKITDGRQAPSRVEAVVAVILKSAITASRSLSGSTKSAIFFQTVNVRNRMSPPISENSIGNLLWQFPVFIEEKEIKVYELVAKIRKEMSEFCNTKAPKLKGAEGFREIMGCIGKWAFHFLTNKDIYRCSSWCRTPLYETDFGWGKPIWVSSAGQDIRNVMILVDSKDGNGMEAWVTLDYKEMDVFEKNEELLEYGSLNPSV